MTYKCSNKSGHESEKEVLWLRSPARAANSNTSQLSRKRPIDLVTVAFPSPADASFLTLSALNTVKSERVDHSRYEIHFSDSAPFVIKKKLCNSGEAIAKKTTHTNFNTNFLPNSKEKKICKISI